MKGPVALGTIRTTPVLGLRLAVQAGTLLLVARMLGPDQFGAFVGITALALMLGTLSTFGTHIVLLGEVSKTPAQRKRVLSYAIPSTLLCGNTLLIIYLLTYTLFLNEEGMPVTVLLAVGVTEILLQPLFGLPTAEHLALGRTARSQLLRILPLALRLTAATSVFLLHSSTPLVAYGYGYLTASVIALGVAIATMPGPWPRLQNWRLPDRKELREAWGYAAQNITSASPAELDKTLAAKLLPLSASGLYAAGARVIGAGIFPVVAMMLSALPRLFREGQNQPERTARLLSWIYTATLTYSMILAVALWLIAPVFIWVFGSKYGGIQHTIHWLCLAVPGMALRMAAGNILMALGKPWMRVGFEITGVIVLVVAAVALTRHFGATGMPLALACSEWMMAILGSSLILYTVINAGRHA